MNKNKDQFPGELSAWDPNPQKQYQHVDKSVPERNYQIDYKNIDPYKTWQCHNCGLKDPPMHSEVIGASTLLFCSNCEALLDEYDNEYNNE